MSDYPSTPHYGANYGGPNQQNQAYLPHTYPNQYAQTDDTHMGQHNYAPNYDANMSAYGYNGGIPGFTPAALASGAPPLPIYPLWNQDHAPLPTYNPPHNGMQHAGYGVQSYDNYAQQYPAPAPQHSYQQIIPSAKPYDEGEVSEGEFDGGYAPQNPAPIEYTPSQYNVNSGNGYMDTAHRAVYARSQDPAPLQGPRTGNEYSYSHEVPKPQPPSSYSPYVTPTREDSREINTTRSEQYNASNLSHTPEKFSTATLKGQNQPPWERNRGVNNSRSISGTNLTSKSVVASTANIPSKPPYFPASATPSAGVAGVVPPSPKVPADSPATQTTLPKQASTVVYDKLELRRKAEGAILNLLPHDIRFEKYMEEGFAEDVVGSLFDSLRVSRTSSKLPGDLGKSRAGSTSHSLVQAPSQKESGALPAIGNNSRAEAQKLDETIGIGNALPTADISKNFSTSNGTSNTNNPAAIGTSEKERTLKLKMEALKRSREERAQKAAAKTTGKPSAPASAAPAVVSTKADLAPGSRSFIPSATLAPPSTVQQPPTGPQQLQPQLAKPQPNSIVSATSIVNNTQAPAIPGLFLAPATASSNSPISTNSLAAVSQINHRKRPVAADFDDVPTASTIKRPFGHSHNDTSLVIDVSEDDNDSDDEDVAMDLDSQADQDSPVQATRKLSDQRSTALQNLPMLTNFPTRKPFTPPPASSAASTPPIIPPIRKPTLGRPEVLQEKEMQIEELRRRIAEAEAAKAQKKAQQSSSGTHTPRSSTANVELKALVDNGMAKKVQASLQLQNIIDVADEKVTLNQKRLEEVQIIEQEKAADLKEQEAEMNRLRREKIATDLPRVDAEVIENQRKLQQLKVQMAEIEAQVQKNLEVKQRMAEEMEKLGREAEDQLQAQKARLQDLAEFDTSTNSIPPRPSPLPIEPPELSLATSTNEDELVPQQEVTLSDRRPSIPPRVQSPVPSSDKPQNERQALTEDAVSDPTEKQNTVTADQHLEAALQEAVRAEVDSHDQSDSDAMDIEDSYAPDPNQLAPESITSTRNDVARSPSYSPAMERAVPHISDRLSEVDYEPPEATPPVNRASSQSPPFSPAPADPITEDVEDLVIFPSNSGPSAADESEAVESSLPQVNGSIPQSIEVTLDPKPDRVQKFTPYESPLKSFRAFRFHPSFNEEVPGGFRSLTYSHKINPKVEFCPWEMAGGACNDKTCDYQHLREIGLPDDAVLSSLGSPEEFTGEQRKQFCDGLKEVLSGLRGRKIRDFDIIAKEVVAHRARFFGDSSKVLMLEGTSI